MTVNATSQCNTCNLGIWDSTGASTPIDIVWASLSNDGCNKVDAALIYLDTGCELTRVPLLYVDLAVDVAPAGNSVKITWAQTGIFRLT